MAVQRQYFIGLGAQKSGTTWLARYLAAHPHVGLGPIKEFHYWSSKFTYHQRYAVWGRHGLPKRLRALGSLMRQTPKQSPALMSAFARMLLHRDSGYRRFLDLSAGNDVAITGEITPVYATLPVEAFAAIDACLNRPRYILMLRNPVDRMISQITHEAKYDAKVRQNPDWWAWIDRPRFALRSNYAMTLATCDLAIPADRLHLVFFEDLFDPDGGQAVCDGISNFLGVEPRPANLGKRENVRRFDRPTFERAEVARRLMPNYRDLDLRYGTALPHSWRQDIDMLKASGHWDA